MMAGGDDGTDKAARVLARRPTIRPRAVTPPRSATATPTPTATATKKLPPMRLPSPRVRATEAERAASRSVLLLVADASDQFEVARLHDHHDDRANGADRPAWRAPRTMALAASTVMVLAAAAVVVAWASGRPTEQLQTSASSTRTAPTSTAVVIALPSRVPAVATSDEPAAPSIPVFDVKSLPPAPRRK
jgi:hypothetical protein